MVQNGEIMTSDKLDLTYYGGQDLYSDGDIEDEMLRIFEEEEDVQSILEKNSDWALLYHLSDMRHTLLDWLPVKKGSTVLEIGAGCGAITGLLCEKFEQVVCVELSKRRSMINAARNKNYDNLKIMVGNFQDIQITEKYDYVTLIGVLEYSASYMGSEMPYEDMLNRVKNYLKPDGKLIIAIENRNGLKYWAGATEDHTGGWFDGVEDYRKHDWIRTFNKREMTELLESCGYVQNDYYYPVPDYKMPRAVYSDAYLPSVGDLRGMDIAFDRPRYKLFEDDVVFDSICRDGKFAEYSNSFLIVAGLQKGAEKEKKVLFSKYNRARRPEFRLATTILEENGSRYVEKKALEAEAAAHIQKLEEKSRAQRAGMQGIQVLIPEIQGDTARYPYLAGENLEQQLQAELKNPDRLITRMKEMIALVEDSCRAQFTEFHMTDGVRSIFGEIPEQGQMAVPNLGIDLLFDNLMGTKGAPISLDCEWVTEDPVPFGYLVYRQVYYFYVRYRYYLEIKLSERAFLEAFGITEEAAALYRQMEANFQQYVQGEGYRYSVTNHYVKTIGQNAFDRIQELEALSSERLEICMERLDLIRHYQRVEAGQQQQIRNLSAELEEVRALLQQQTDRAATLENQLQQSGMKKILSKAKRIPAKLTGKNNRK